MIKGTAIKNLSLDGFKQLYIDNKFDEATVWLQDNHSQLPVEIFHYNMGTILSKKNDFSLARFHFEKAKSEGLNSFELKNNLEFVKDKLNVAGVEQNQISSSLIGSLSSVPTDLYLTFFLFFTLLAALVLKYKKKLFTPIILLLIGSSSLAVNYLYVKKFNFAVILKETSVHEGPGEIFQTNTNAASGIKIIYEKQYEDWIFVIHPTSLSGWLNVSDIGKL